MRRDDFRKRIEADVRYANITIIEGINASQYGIGMVSARIAEAYGATLSLPSIVGRQGIVDVIELGMSTDERQALRRSGETIRKAEMHHTH